MVLRCGKQLIQSNLLPKAAPRLSLPPKSTKFWQRVGLRDSFLHGDGKAPELRQITTGETSQEHYRGFRYRTARDPMIQHHQAFTCAKIHHLQAAGGKEQAPRDGDKHPPNISLSLSPVSQL